MTSVLDKVTVQDLEITNGVAPVDPTTLAATGGGILNDEGTRHFSLNTITISHDPAWL